MREFNELECTNKYLVNELIKARQKNETMEENNRRVELLLVQTIKDLQDCNRLIDEMKFAFGELATVAINRSKRS